VREFAEIVNRSLDSIREEMGALDRAGLRRSLRVAEPRPGSRAVVGGREVLVLCSNDYLGLADDRRLADAAAGAARADGAGAGAARLVTGTRPAHAALEHAVAAFTGAEAALTFSSGYAGNLAILGALLGPEDLAVSDALNHASLVDGLRLSGATKRIVPHCDVAAVREALRGRDRFRRAAIVTEGLFSMDGDVAPLAELVEIADEAGALLVVDDAHGTGVLGATGRGALELCGVAAGTPELVRVGTFGKAFGAAGAFVAGAREVVDLVVHRGRGFVFSTAPSPTVVAAAAAGLAVASAEPERRRTCLARAARLRGALRERGVAVPAGDGPILPLVLGDPARAVAASERLLDAHGILVSAIRPPTVPEGTSRLRVTTNAAVSDADIDRAAAALAEVLR
jgi:8-amino-7-oxononanoate synthase